MSTNAVLPDGGIPEPVPGINGIVEFVKQSLASGELADVRFNVGRQTGLVKDFSAHKFVLGFRSTVFRTMFYGSLPEKHPSAIDIPDLQPDAFAIMLSFVYTDAVDGLSADNVFGTMKCADKYDLPQLLKICTDFVVDQLKPENCLTTMKLALDWQAENIVEKCLALVDTKTAAVLWSKEFTKISRSMLHTILQRSELSAEENVIYLAVERWAAAACARSFMDASGANRRKVLGDALFLVRFPLLGNAQLADGPGKSGLLTEAEMLNLFMYRNAAVKPHTPFPTAHRRYPFRAPSSRPLFSLSGGGLKRSAGSVWPWPEPVGVPSLFAAKRR
ncbi:BTB/POZ domain-containing protein 6-like [Paramacrobiotus metropolitanus]|uniref:BTB/POZ domain-containing protein 6-like n=1 Tax=Paramacrobiotus metropolitanus TaxID=2943436 RepID=UPI002445A209|nr:BTB/POZ domain-containing protein 6-like [Paramacrobiotus metropolitanus]